MTIVDKDERWAVPCCGYHIQARPDQSSTEQLLALQQELLGAFPAGLHLIPSQALHLSVATLVEAQPPTLGNAQWTRIEEAVRLHLHGFKPREPYSIRFEGLAYSKHAIFVHTTNLPPALIDTRLQIGALLRSMGSAFPDYDQAHVTIARFSAQVHLTDAKLSLFRRLDENLTVQFEPERLVRELRYPSLEIEEI